MYLIIPATLDDTRGVTSVKSIKGISDVYANTRGIKVLQFSEPKRTLRRAVPKAVGTLGVKCLFMLLNHSIVF